jgi:hypothetical protein
MKPDEKSDWGKGGFQARRFRETEGDSRTDQSLPQFVVLRLTADSSRERAAQAKHRT